MHLNASHRPSKTLPGFCLAWACVGILAVSSTQGALAQTIYRSVGPGGQVTYSDMPPANGAKQSGTIPISSAVAGSARESFGGDLPYALKQVADQFPVVLYASANCMPCASGRSLLTSRGIPFLEKAIDTQEDALALQRLSGETALPMLTIGGQHLKGFSEMEWTQFLDTAGYPKRAALPSNFRWPAPGKLVSGLAVDAMPPAAPKAAVKSLPTTAAPTRPADNNPSGIRF